MRLRKILLGSAAVLMGAGVASVPAKAADMNDMNGLVTTMANYVESCANGAGLVLKTTCWSISGSVSFKAADGARINWGYGPTDDDFFDPDEPDGDGGTDVDDTTYTGANAYNAWSGAATFGMKFEWSTANYDVTINLPDPFGAGLGKVSVNIAQSGGMWFFIQNGGVSSSRSQIEFGMPLGPVNMMVGLDDVGAADPLDLTLGVDGEFGNFGFDASVVLEDVLFQFDPRFSLELTGEFGPVGFDVDVATRDWGGALDPTVDVRLMAGFGAFSLTGYFGWENDGGDTDRVIGAEAEAEFGDNTLTLGFLHGEAGHGVTGTEDDKWGFGPSDPFPYMGLGEGDTFYTIWGGFSRTWNPSHTTALNVIYANSTDAILEHPDYGDPDPGPLTLGTDYDCSVLNCGTLRAQLTHTWKPVDGAVSVTTNLYADNALGNADGWVFGFDIGLKLDLLH